MLPPDSKDATHFILYANLANGWHRRVANVWYYSQINTITLPPYSTEWGLYDLGSLNAQNYGTLKADFHHISILRDGTDVAWYEKWL